MRVFYDVLMLQREDDQSVSLQILKHSGNIVMVLSNITCSNVEFDLGDLDSNPECPCGESSYTGGLPKMHSTSSPEYIKNNLCHSMGDCCWKGRIKKELYT